MSQLRKVILDKIFFSLLNYLTADSYLINSVMQPPNDETQND